MGEQARKEDSSEKKKNEEIVLKVDMHCEACARKVVEALKGFPGVEEVMADCNASKVVVRGGAADPLKVCERIQKKSGRKVEIISPLPKKQENDNQKQHGEDNKDSQPKQESKQEPPAVITVALKVRMHCEACAQALQKILLGKVNGVESVATDIANDRVIVKGVFDPDKLVNDIYKRTGKQASIVKGEEKKDEEKKEEAKESKEEENEDKKIEIKKMEYWPPRYYYMEDVYAPQIFSDENPNACFIM